MRFNEFSVNVLLKIAGVICMCCALAACPGPSPKPTSGGSGQTPQAASSGQTAKTSDGSCDTVAACAQKAVEAAQGAQQTANNTNKALASLNQQVQGLQSNVDTIVQNYTITNAQNGTPATGPGGNGTIALNNSVSCPAGQYLAGLNLAWAGTCHGSCNEDGGVLHTITPICKPLFPSGK